MRKTLILVVVFSIFAMLAAQEKPIGTPHAIVMKLYHEDGKTTHKEISLKFTNEEYQGPGLGPFYMNWEDEEDTAKGSKYDPETGTLLVQLGVLSVHGEGHHIHVWLIGDDGTETDLIIPMAKGTVTIHEDLSFGKTPYEVKSDPTKKYGE